jgi:hypothetical protein
LRRRSSSSRLTPTGTPAAGSKAALTRSES